MARKFVTLGKSQDQPETKENGEQGAGITKVEAVRRALKAGKRSPGAGTAYMLSEYGIVMNRQQFSTTKSQLKTRAGKMKGKPGRKPKSLVEGYVAPPAKRSTGGETELLAAMEAMKPLVDSLGVEKVIRIAELLG